MSTAKVAAEVFLEHAARTSSQPGDEVGLGETLVAALDAGRSRWPELHVPEFAFYGWLAQRVGDGDPVEELSTRRVADLYFTCACAIDIPGARDEFVNEFGNSIRKHVARLGVAQDEREDVVQEIVSNLLVGKKDAGGRIQSFGGRSGLKQWLAAVVANRVIENARRRGRRPAVSADESLSRIVDIEADGFEALRGEHRSLFKDSVKGALEELEPKKRLLLLQHYVDRLTLDRLARMHDVHHTTVSRWLRQSRTRVAERTRELVLEAGVKADDYSSLVRVVQSQLDLTLTRFRVDSAAES